MATILILEDDYEQANAWRAALRHQNHTVDVCFSTTEAMACVDHSDYDLCIVDLVLFGASPEHRESGRLFLKFLRSRAAETGTEIRIIGVSGFAPFGDSRVAESVFNLHNASRFIQKPVTSEVLVEAVEELV